MYLASSARVATLNIKVLQIVNRGYVVFSLERVTPTAVDRTRGVPPGAGPSTAFAVISLARTIDNGASLRMRYEHVEWTLYR